jgi:hypothetical protein
LKIFLKISCKINKPGVKLGLEDKAMKKSNFIVWKFMLLSSFVFFTSCIFQPDFPTEASAPNNTPEREFLAMLKARDNHTLSDEELEKLVSGFLNGETPGRSLAPAGQTQITGSNELALTNEKRFPLSSRARSAGAAEEPVRIYSFTTENPDTEQSGYVLATNDIRLGNILAVVDEGALDDEETAWFTDIVFDGLEGFIDRTIAEYETISDEEARQALARAAARSVVTINGVVDGDPEVDYGNGSITPSPGQTNLGAGGLYQTQGTTTKTLVQAVWYWYDGYYATIPVKWNQGTPYNQVVNDARNGPTDDYYVTGCGPTAIAQLTAFHERPLTCKVNQTVPYVNENYYNHTYDWALMKSPLLSSDDNSTKINRNKDIAILMYEIGKRAGATYHAKVPDPDPEKVIRASTSTSNSGMITALTQMGYTTPGSFTSYDFSAISNSIADNKPVIVTGYTDQTNYIIITVPAGTGHFWLIDGVRRMSYIEYFSDGSSYSYTTPGAETGHGSPDLSYVRCNLGWGGLGNAWYRSEIFDCRNNHQALARAVKDDQYYRYFLKILPDVTWGGN